MSISSYVDQANGMNTRAVITDFQKFIQRGHDVGILLFCTYCKIPIAKMRCSIRTWRSDVQLEIRVGNGIGKKTS